MACGREAIAAGADILVMDDGFQHLRLHRDADLVLLDALRPFDNGWVIPAGLLREPIGALEAADLIAVTRVELVSEERREAIVAVLKELSLIHLLRCRRYSFCSTRWSPDH